MSTAIQPDLYKVLGVAPSATRDEIRKAYRSIARENHPDVNANDPEKEKKFSAAAAAYSTLSDAQKRDDYDKQRAGRPLWTNKFGDPVSGVDIAKGVMSILEIVSEAFAMDRAHSELKRKTRRKKKKRPARAGSKSTQRPKRTNERMPR